MIRYNPSGPTQHPVKRSLGKHEGGEVAAYCFQLLFSPLYYGQKAPRFLGTRQDGHIERPSGGKVGSLYSFPVRMISFKTALCETSLSFCARITQWAISGLAFAFDI